MRCGLDCIFNTIPAGAKYAAFACYIYELVSIISTSIELQDSSITNKVQYLQTWPAKIFLLFILHMMSSVKI
jgi:hypothetical protein